MDTLRPVRLGFALDLGTTTISGSLVDLDTGERLAHDTLPNPQARYGADVVTRLTSAAGNRSNALEMQRLAVSAAKDLLGLLCARISTPVDAVESAALVGNTVMHHLAFGLDVSGLCRAPFTPACREVGNVALPGLPPLYAVPIIGAFVGSDAVAAALSTSLCDPGGIRLLIDIGTNTEALLWREGALLAASAPAGPAFEGGEISCGMLARPGAIDSVRFAEGSLQVTTIGGGRPEGVCGSGLFDAVSVLLEAGAIDATGRLRRGGPLLQSVIAGADGGATGVRLALGVVLTQKDVRAFQLAKGAVRCAVDLLLGRVGAASRVDVDQVLLAGSFGTFLDRRSAVVTGVVPPLDAGKIRPVGNAALAGAEMVLRSPEAKAAAARIAEQAVHVELSLEPSFQDVFLRSLEFHMAMPQGTR